MARMPACLLVKAEVALIGLLILGYIAINLMADLPRFLVAENLALAAAYTAVLALILSGHKLAQPLAIFISAFNAGRVSRSIVTPEGELAELAREHLPLLAAILLVSLLALAAANSEGCMQG